jgi:triphosphoribosyl-dephospho-CoA synthase
MGTSNDGPEVSHEILVRRDPHPLDAFRRWIRSPRDAVLWACVLEATAPKLGNVHPSAQFVDLNFQHFVISAKITADCLCQLNQSLAMRMNQAVEQSRAACGSNVNLGIVLLLGPLYESASLVHTIQKILHQFTPADGSLLMQTIAGSGAGGLGTVNDRDVSTSSGLVDIIEAMRSAEDRDMIARQYARGFPEVLGTVADTLDACIIDRKDVLTGIAAAQLKILSFWPDSLIERKCGRSTATAIQHQAASVDFDDEAAMANFDASLRVDGNRLNPGTTADLIAAGLFCLLYKPIQPSSKIFQEEHL